MSQLLWNTSTDLLKLYQKGGILPSEVFKSCLQYAKKLQELNVFTCLNQNQDLSECDQRWKSKSPISNLDGIPIVFKDNFTFEKYPTTCGSKMLEPFVPTYSATVIEKAKKAGMPILGKTNLDEFGMGVGGTYTIFNETKSLWGSKVPYKLIDRQTGNTVLENIEPLTKDDNDWIVSGGSSSGSAVAVASGICLAALGSDTGGSVRVPGAWNGLFTLKPSYGLLSRHGLIPLTNSMDVPGIMARCVDDLELVFKALQGHDIKDSTSVQQNEESLLKASRHEKSHITIGIPQEYYCKGMDEETLKAWSDVADLFDNHPDEFKVKKVSMPHTQYSSLCYTILNPCEVASNMSRYDSMEYGPKINETGSTDSMYASSRHYGFNQVVRGRILAGNFFLLRDNQKEYFYNALKVRRIIHQDFQNVWKEDIDLLLAPVTLGAAPLYSEFSKSDNRSQTSKNDYCTQPANLSGIPSTTFPVNLNHNKLPISLQLMAPIYQDFKLLKITKWIENKLNFPFMRIQ